MFHSAKSRGYTKQRRFISTVATKKTGCKFTMTVYCVTSYPPPSPSLRPRRHTQCQPLPSFIKSRKKGGGERRKGTEALKDDESGRKRKKKKTKTGFLSWLSSRCRLQQTPASTGRLILPISRGAVKTESLSVTHTHTHTYTQRRRHFKPLHRHALPLLSDGQRCMIN